MKRDYKLFINDIKDSVELIDRYLQGKTLNNFKGNIQLQDSVMRRLEIIGEAVKNIPKSLKQINKEFPWVEAGHLRDLIAHYYHQISIDSVWMALKINIPKIKEALKNIKLV